MILRLNLPRRRLLQLIVLGSILLGGTPSAQAQCARAETLAEFPSGTFLENLAVLPDGRVLFTSYFGREILAHAPGGATTRFATLPAHPVAVLPLGSGELLVSAHGTPFTAGPGFATTQRLLRLDSSGALLAETPLPEARFLNGMATLPDGSVLAADSIAATLWRVDPVAGTARAWLSDPRLAASQDGGFRPGANGVKLHDGRVFVSSSAAGALFAVGLTTSLDPAGPLAEVARPGGIDDFAIAPDGTVVLATHATSIQRIAPDGTVAVVLPEAAEGATAVAFVPGATPPREAYALTTGGLLEGGKAPARLLRLALPGGATMCP